MINPLGELDRLLRGLCDDSEIDVELPPERVAEIQNKLNGFFQTLDNECTYSHWYFGSMHEDRMVTPNSQMI